MRKKLHYTYAIFVFHFLIKIVVNKISYKSKRHEICNRNLRNLAFFKTA